AASALSHSITFSCSSSSNVATRLRTSASSSTINTARFLCCACPIVALLPWAFVAIGVACDLTTDVANEPAEPGAQNAQLSAVAIELFGVGITACHHGGALGDAQVRLPQPHAVLSGQSGQPLDRGV